MALFALGEWSLTPVLMRSLFYCGDTCQTIARGIGFRFTDIRTLLYEEAQEQRQLERGGKGHFDRVGVPTIEHLKVAPRLQRCARFRSPHQCTQACLLISPGVWSC